jgi:hypothetical protein
MTKKTLASIAVAVTFALSFSVLAAESTAPRKTLKAFASEEELAELFKGWAAEYAARRRDEAARRAQAPSGIGMMQSAPAPASTPALAAKESAASASADSVTNVQHAGRRRRDRQIARRPPRDRRGRLFTVRVGDRDLKPVRRSTRSRRTSIRAARGTTKC